MRRRRCATPSEVPVIERTRRARREDRGVRDSARRCVCWTLYAVRLCRNSRSISPKLFAVRVGSHAPQHTHVTHTTHEDARGLSVLARRGAARGRRAAGGGATRRRWRSAAAAPAARAAARATATGTAHTSQEDRGRLRPSFSSDNSRTPTPTATPTRHTRCLCTLHTRWTACTVSHIYKHPSLAGRRDQVQDYVAT